MKTKKDIKICFVCNLSITHNLKIHNGLAIHKKCENQAMRHIAQAYEIQKEWEHSLNDTQKIIIALLQKNKEMTIFELSNESNISLSGVQKILSSFKHKIKKHGTIKNGNVEFKYVWHHNFLDTLKEKANKK